MRTRSVLVVAVGMVGVLASSSIAASRHTVRNGETLTAIASRLGVSVKDLAAANNISDPNRVVAGEVLVVPSKSSAVASTTTYVVRKGDSLDSIATRLGIASDRLAEANRIKNRNHLPIGKVLTLPASTSPTRSQTDGTYTVRKGDTLIAIAARVGVSSSELAAANNLKRPDRIFTGQVLAVPGGWRCPVGGTPSFVNDYSYVKPGATVAHNGIDLFAAKGTPVVAPVSGRSVRHPNPKGGNAVHLYGDDGTRYYFAHLDRYGESGRVTAGAVIGYLGNTGNAHTTSPHLHFESRPGGGALANPYKTLVEACR